MDPDFVIEVKGTIFGLNRGSKGCFDLYAADFPKNTGKNFYFGTMASTQCNKTFRYFSGNLQHIVQNVYKDLYFAKISEPRHLLRTVA